MVLTPMMERVLKELNKAETLGNQGSLAMIACHQKWVHTFPKGNLKMIPISITQGKLTQNQLRVCYKCRDVVVVCPFRETVYITRYLEMGANSQ